MCVIERGGERESMPLETSAPNKVARELSLCLCHSHTYFLECVANAKLHSAMDWEVLGFRV